MAFEGLESDSRQVHFVLRRKEFRSEARKLAAREDKIRETGP